MSKAMSKQSRVSRCLKAPARLLAKARKLYVYCVTECADRLGGSSVMGCPTGQASSLPRSFSTAASSSSSSSYWTNGDEDARELMRAASTRNRMLGITPTDDQPEPEPEKKSSFPPRRPPLPAPRSYSIAIGRIDEEEPCEFGEDEKKVAVYPRSRSAYGVPKLRTSALRREI